MIAALLVAAMATPPACARIGPIYWEVGDARGALERGIHGSTIGPDTVLPVASATKWLFAAYVAQTGKLGSKEAKDALDDLRLQQHATARLHLRAHRRELRRSRRGSH